MRLYPEPRLLEQYRYQQWICRVITVQFNASSPDMVQIQYAAQGRIEWLDMNAFMTEASRIDDERE